MAFSQFANAAMQALARQIAQNACDDGPVIVGKILENGSYAWGYDAQTGTYPDLVWSTPQRALTGE